MIPYRNITILWTAVSLTAVPFMGGCDLRLTKIYQRLTGKKPPSAEVENEQAPIELIESERAKQAQRNAEILQEVWRVAYVQTLTNRSVFKDWLETLNQGASFEGVYNGFTHSQAWRMIENRNPGTTPEALDFFSSELIELQRELESPTPLRKSTALPLAQPIDPADPNSHRLLDLTAPLDLDLSDENGILKARATVRVLFEKSSTFTLKRVLGDELVRLINEKSADPNELSKWYARWAVRLNGLGVDFGLQQRNLADIEFHQQWALKASRDQLIWEALNRIHRVLNQKGKLSKAQ